MLAMWAMVAAITPVSAEGAVRTVEHPPLDTRNSHYVHNRAPLRASPLLKLPIGSIKPKSWLLDQLQMQADGMTGHLDELSQYVKNHADENIRMEYPQHAFIIDESAWLNKEGKGSISSWEEVPYWLRGYGDLGYVLGDKKIIKETKRWIDAVIASQQEDGWFGPLVNKNGEKGPGLWPNMIMLNVLQSYYEYSDDKRVLDLMTDYFRWQLKVPDKEFLVGFWDKQRASDNMESVYWLYNRTGDRWLLELGEKIFRNMARWDKEVTSWHGVNASQGFRAPGIYFLQSKNGAHLGAAYRNYDEIMGRYGQVPGGMFGADENARDGYHGPRQAAETCSMVEFMHSFEMLGKITADVRWYDRCEDVAFNSLPAALTPDLRALHYLTAPNQVLLDAKSHHPGIEQRNKSSVVDRSWFAYSPHSRTTFPYRCCLYNHGQGWPYYAGELWHATSDNGVAASLYCASTVSAKVGDGTMVEVEQKTDYPFGEDIILNLNPEKPVAFPLYLRIPQWCSGAEAWLNGEKLDIVVKGPSYLVIDREWKAGDSVAMSLPMELRATVWDKDFKNARTEPNGSVSISHGPLTYSLKIGEKWVKIGGSDKWPIHRVEPTTPWNYSLVVDPDNPEKTISVKERKRRLAKQPFTLENAPIVLRAKAKKIPNWKIDELGMVGRMQANPIRSSQPLEEVELVPMGCARLRISAFPRIDSGSD